MTKPPTIYPKSATAAFALTWKGLLSSAISAVLTKGIPIRRDF